MADLGLLILEEAHFLDAAQTFLSEKYGVAMEHPDPDFEEWTVVLPWATYSPDRCPCGE